MYSSSVLRDRGQNHNPDEQCIVCGKQTTFCCSKCRRIFYCSQTCQRVDWRSHKITCTDAKVTPGVEMRQPDIDLSLHARATDILTECLMGRFGSIVGAYEWFDANRGGYIDYVEFEKLVIASKKSSDLSYVRSLFSALDRANKGRVSLSEFLSQAVNGLPASPRSVSPEVPAEYVISAGRRALRAAALLAFRNGRYSDAVVSALQALGVSNSKTLESLTPHPEHLVELLLLAKCPSTNLPLLLSLITKIVPAGNDENSSFPPPSRSTLLLTIAQLYGSRSLAETYFQAYLQSVASQGGERTLIYSDALTIVGSFYLEKNRIKESIECTRKANEIRSKLLPAPHARAADSLNNLATCLKAGKDFSSAIPFFSAALEMRIELFGPISVPVADTQFSLAPLVDSLRMMAACHSTRLKLLGPAHADSLLAAKILREMKPTVTEPSYVAKLKDAVLFESQQVEQPVMNVLPSVSVSENTSMSDEPLSKNMPRSPQMRNLAPLLIKLPEGSRFAAALADLGPEQFMDCLLQGDPNLIEGEPDFNIEESLPSGPPEVVLAMKEMFAVKLLAAPDESGVLYELFSAIKRSEQVLTVMFAILNSIYIKLERMKNLPGDSQLVLSNFDEFIHSRAANVSLIECLMETLDREKPELLPQFLSELSLLAGPAVDPQRVFAYETALNSLKTIGGNEDKVAEMESRLNTFANGIRVVCVLFKITTENVATHIGEALNLLRQFYLLIKHEDEGSDSGSEESDSQSEDSESDSEDSESESEDSESESEESSLSNHIQNIR